MSKNAEPTMEITCKSSEITIHRIYAEHTKKNMLEKKKKWTDQTRISEKKTKKLSVSYGKSPF